MAPVVLFCGPMKKLPLYERMPAWAFYPLTTGIAIAAVLLTLWAAWTLAKLLSA